MSKKKKEKIYYDSDWVESGDTFACIAFLVSTGLGIIIFGIVVILTGGM